MKIDFKNIYPEGMKIAGVEWGKISTDCENWYDAMTVNWECELGFGQLTLVYGENGELVARTECMGRQFMERVLRALAREIKIVE